MKNARCGLAMKVDSRISHSDSKIVELESGFSKETSANAERYPLFCKPRAEISLERLSHKRGAGIADSSPQAESPRGYFLPI
ncbi:hypothetical protein [Helicobacter canis]|uniref:Uncharacterized protein n=1 Tax=Helicobacter canis TaxID=29419 RepID=A0A5M9QIF7_9HELI|nr:hypothetical protein [Helicobacter canis]KAA8707646.1 hypothetical protein F4V45_07155 [Helicobacter canis]